MSRSTHVRDAVRAVIGGVLGAAVAFAAAYAVGSVTGFEAIRLIEISLPTTRLLASAMISASAVILALMLTLLGFSYSTDLSLRTEHYQRVKLIALVDTVGFVVATLFLLLLNIPVAQGKNLPVEWYDTIYHAVLAIASGLGGLLITVVLMLYSTVRHVIDMIEDLEDDTGGGVET